MCYSVAACKMNDKICVDIAAKVRLWGEVSFLDGDSIIAEVLGLRVVGNVDNANDFAACLSFVV